MLVRRASAQGRRNARSRARSSPSRRSQSLIQRRRHPAGPELPDRRRADEHQRLAAVQAAAAGGGLGRAGLDGARRGARRVAHARRLRRFRRPRRRARHARGRQALRQRDQRRR